jgi:hypothetical protein
MQPVALRLVQPRPQHAQSLRLVLVLRLLVLLDHRQSGRNVHDPHRAVGRVDRLAARPRRAIDVDAQVLVVDLDVDLLRLGQHRDRRRRGVDPAARLGRGHALDAVDAAFELQLREHALPRHAGDDFLEAACVGRRAGDQLDPPALRFGITLVHPEQIAREQRRFVATGARAHLEHRRALIRGIARQQRERELAVRGLEQRAILVQFLRRHRAQLVIGILGHEGEALGLLPQPPHLGRGLRDGFELGIFLRHRDEAIGRQVAGRHQRLQLVAPRLDRADAVRGDLGHADAPSCVIPANAGIQGDRAQPSWRWIPACAGMTGRLNAAPPPDRRTRPRSACRSRALSPRRRPWRVRHRQG